MKKLFLLFVAVLAMGICAVAQNRTIRGTVIDANTNEPLVGASVVPAGTTMGTTTDVDGNFSLVIGPNVHEITVSYVGYDSRTLPVKDRMTISLTSSSEMLNTVVVTGYGSGKKLGSMTGSVAVVGQAALANVTTPSFVDALQGKVSGLSVLSNSGDPSSVQNQIRLRGVNSLNSSNTPLFILDGAPVTQTVFSTLNPNDIESITVLKDAASVAIYGSRAANGVIVITSKRGKYAEKTSINIRAKYGWSQMTTDKTEMMNSEQYIHYRDLINQPVSQEMRDAWEIYGIDTNWRDEIFSGSAPTYSLDASVSGGTETLNYYLSVNYLDQDGIIDQSAMRRETLRYSMSTRITDWLQIGVQSNLGYTKFEQNNESNAIYSGGGVYGGNPMVQARKALPMDSPRYYTIGEDGKIVWGEEALYLHFTQLPLAKYFQKNRSVWRNRVTFNGNLWESITPITGLTIRAQQAIDAYDYKVNNYGYAHDVLVTPMGDVYDDGSEDGELVAGYNGQTFSRYYQWTITNTAEYRFKLADVHNFSVLIGQESIYAKTHSFNGWSEGQTDRRLFLLGQGSSNTFDVGESISEMSMNSYFGNISYNYDNKYFLDLNLRRDGSSYFAPGHRWATFYSAGLMWDMKQEKFLRDVTWLDDLRFHVSYGTTGNSSFANYAYFGLVSSGSNYNGGTSLGIAQAPNYDLTWETVGGLDVGVEFSVFNQLEVKAAFYNKNTSDMLVEVPYSYTTGVSSGWGNIAKMRNTGIDFDITWAPVKTRDWYFDVHANFNYNKNKITKLFDDLDELPFLNANVIYKVDHRANEFYMVRYAGVDPRDGQQMWYTREGNLTKTFNEERDAVCVGKSQYAPWAGGFGFSLSWKGLSLLTDFTWAAKKYMINNDLWFVQNNNFAQSFNQTTKMLDVWTTPGDVTDIPAVGQTLQFDTRWLEDASFVRLKNLTLQYALPKNWVSKVAMTDVKVHFTGRNLLTFTGYSGYDPEPETNVIAFFYPNTRQYEFGIDVSF